MYIVFLLVQLLIHHFFILLIRAQPSNYPLLFNPYASVAYLKKELTSENNPPFIYPVLAACPAKSKEEKEMNENQSIDHKALFVREFYDKGVTLDNMIRCESNFELAVAVDSFREPRHITFGYEIYFEKSVIPEKAERINTSHFGSYESISGRHRPRNSPFLAENRPLEFIWLERFKVEFFPYTGRVENVTYTVFQSASKIDVKCDDNNLGKQFYDNQSVDLISLYSMENQENILKGIELPKETTCQSAENGCLEKYNLLMPYHFQSIPSSTVSCSDLTSIPIWHEVNKKLLDYSEKFITAISEVTRQKLTVTSIVHQILLLPYKNPDTGITERKHIFLDWVNRNFSVPRIIYKMVNYEISYCNETVDSCWFDMVLVIHNEPKFTQPLCQDKCEEWGWDSIQYLSTTEKNIEKKSQYIYCCELKEVLKILGTSFALQINYDMKDLNLKRFPNGYDENSKKIKYEDMQREFEAKMNDLFEH